MIILRATNDNGVVQDLDVMDVNQPLRLDISAIENTSIGTAYGVSSQTFSLPGTDKNNQFFGNLYNLGTTPSVALQDSIDCQLLTDGQGVFKGKLYINDIVTDQKGYTTYQVTLVNETVDFKFQLTDVALSTLDWSAYNHTYSLSNITGSWDGLLFSGSIVYPNVKYGSSENDNTAPEYAFGTSPAAGTFDTSDTPLRVIDFKPAVKVKTVLDVIFDSVDYKYTSSFIDSAYFDTVYTLATPNDQVGVQNANVSSGSVWAYRTLSGQSFNAMTSTIVNYNAEYFDNFNRFDLSTDSYTAYTTGLYNFALGFDFTITNFNINNRLRFNVALVESGSTGNVFAQKNFSNPAAAGVLYVPFPNVSLNVGQKVQVQIELITAGGTEVVTIQPTVNTYFKVQGPASLGGGTVDMALQWPSDLKALDFLQGLIEKFNLVIEPIPGERNLLRIEPFQNWVDAGAVKDWTDKVDRRTKFKISHPIVEQPKVIEFRDADDEAGINKYTQNTFGEVYGTYLYENDSDLPVGVRTIGRTFAATPVKGIVNGPSFIIPDLSRNDNGRYRPFQFKPRLLHANGKKTVPIEALGYNSADDTYGDRYFVRDEFGDVKTLSYWYQMTPWSDVPATFNSSLDLHFGNNRNPGWWPYFQSTGINGKVVNAAFHTYWETYVNSLYDIDARKLTCNVYFRPEEVQGIGLNDKIFIDGHYYRINRISGVNISEDASVEVEFIKELNTLLKYPRRRVTTGNTSSDIIIREEVESGGVIYEEFEGGATVSDYGRLSQVGPKDGLVVFQQGVSGSATWDNLPPVQFPLDQAVYGSNNDVDPEAGRVQVTGTKNTVEARVNDSDIVGSFNSVGEYSNTVTVSGLYNTVDLNQSNVSIVAGYGNEVTQESTNAALIAGSGSTIYSSDYSANINSQAATIRESDFTTLINGHSNEVVLNGSGHAVIGLNREGDGLDLLNTRPNSNWLGDTYLGGALFRDQVQLECGDGYEIILTGSNYGDGRHENLYILNWSGLSPGTTTIELPSATNNDYEQVVYQFQTNGTFDGTTEVEITGFSGLGQTINGEASYIISDPYAGVTLTTYNGDWIVLSSAASEGVGFWGSFYASASQPLDAPGVSQSIALTSTYGSNEVYIASGSRIYFNYPGVYQFNYNVQVANQSSQQEQANFWIKYNGADYPNSNTFISLAAEKNASTPTYQLMACSFTGTAQNANDYIELYWNGTSTDLSLYSTGSNGEPATPSVIANIIPVGTSAVINAATAVSASYATSASYAVTASYALNASSVNIYNSDGSLTGNRTVTLDGNNLEFVADAGESFIISSNPSSTIEFTNITQASQSMVLGYNASTGQLTAMNTGSMAVRTAATASSVASGGSVDKLRVNFAISDLGRVPLVYGNTSNVPLEIIGSTLFYASTTDGTFYTPRLYAKATTGVGGLMTLDPWPTLPTASSHANTFAVSGSKPYFSDGSTWTALY